MGGSPVREPAGADSKSASGSTAQPPPQDPRVAVLERELERRDEMLTQLLTRAPAQGDDRRAPAPPPKPGAPPDAIREPEKFKQWAQQVVDYNEAAVRGAVDAGRQEIAEAQRLERMWTTFSRDFPELAKHEDLCRAAFSSELQSAGGDLRAVRDDAAFVRKIGERLLSFQNGATAAPKAGASAGAATAGVSAGSDGGAGGARVIDPVAGPAAAGPAGSKPFATQLEEVRAKRHPDLFGGGL
jgi:hypothetical protein